MKQLFKILVEHIKKDFHWPSFFYAIIFCLIVFYFKNEVQLFKWWLNSSLSGIEKYLLTTAYNILIYNIVLIPILLFRKKSSILRRIDFHVKSIFFLSLISLNFQGFFNKIFLADIENTLQRVYWRLIINNTNELIVILALLLLFKLLFDRKESHFYGLNRKNANLRLFAPLLFIILPMVIWAAFQADFRNTYPTFKPWLFKTYFENNTWLASLIYELSHAFNYIYTELLFRGILVVGLAGILGTEALLPMASLYLIYHFGKPDAEILSSFFGGYILGVFALKFNNIWGGSLIHIALALLMNIAALVYIIVFTT